jgi:hypothetical protein
MLCEQSGKPKYENSMVKMEACVVGAQHAKWDSKQMMKEMVQMTQKNDKLSV